MYMQDHVPDVPSSQANDKSERASIDVGSDKDLVGMAASFSRKVPGGRFSPAAIQGYVLKYKDEPMSALRDVDVWVAKQLASD